MFIEARGLRSLTMYTVIWQGDHSPPPHNHYHHHHHHHDRHNHHHHHHRHHHYHHIAMLITLTMLRLRGFYGTLGIDLEDCEVVLSEARSLLFLLFSFFSFLTNFPFFLSFLSILFFSFYLSEKSSNNCTFYYRSGAEQLRWRLSNINRAFCPKVLYSLTLRRKLFCLKVLSFLLKRNLKQGFVFSNFEEKLLKHLT